LGHVRELRGSGGRVRDVIALIRAVVDAVPSASRRAPLEAQELRLQA